MIEGHGDDLYRYERPLTANFSSNLTNWIDPAPLTAYLRDRLAHVLPVYPEPRPYTLESHIARRLGIDASNVCVTHGATEAIYLIAGAFPPAECMVCQPTFSEYADACRLHGHRVTSCHALPEDGLLPAQVGMLWLCNPNNPTGRVIARPCIERLLRRNPHVLFVIDQSYEAFTLRPLLSAQEAASYPNLLLLHSMTKRYAMPGLRLGYVTGASSLLQHVQRHRMPWSVNGLAIAAGLYLTAHPEAVPFDLTGCLTERTRWQAELRGIAGLQVWDTDTHFMLVQLHAGSASALKEYLAGRHGILVRDASNFNGLDSSCFRISTQRREENDRLTAALRQACTLLCKPHE